MRSKISSGMGYAALLAVVALCMGPLCPGDSSGDNNNANANANMNANTNTNTNSHADCVDADGDGYGDGTDCLGPDCDDSVANCTTDCSDTVNDGIADCALCPDQLRLVGQYMAGPNNATEADGVFAVPPLVYVTSADGLRILDAQDGANPQLVAHTAVTSNSWEVLVSGTTAYVGHGGGDVTLFDVSAPAQPAQLGHVAIATAWSNPSDFQLMGDRLYMAAGKFSVLDVSDPALPVELASYPTLNFSYGIYVEPNELYAFMARDNGGVLPLDITDLGDIQELPTAETPGTSWALAPYDHYLFTACGYGGLALVDIANPAATTVSTLSVDFDSLADVQVHGALLFAADEIYGVRIWEVSNPLQPTAVAAAPKSDGSGSLNHIHREGGYIYATTRWHGLNVFSMVCQN